MGYHDHDRDTNNEGLASRFEFTTTARNVTEVLGRLAGIALILIGLTLGTRVIFESWDLYLQPQRIDRFVVEINRIATVSYPAHSTPTVQEAGGEMGRPAKADPLDQRLSYMMAWVLALILLLLLGLLAFKAIHVGGGLAMHRSRRTAPR